MPENDYYPPWRPDRFYYAFHYDYDHTEPLDNEEQKIQNEADAMEEKVEDIAYVMKGEKGSWCLKHVERVGMDEIPRTKEELENNTALTVLTPSDHYGLIATFECMEMSVEELQNKVQSQTTRKSKSCVIL